MKTFFTLFVSGSLALTLVSCKPNTSAQVDEHSSQQLEATQAEYARKAADMQSRSEDLQNQLAELQRTIQDKENAKLKAQLDAIAAENQKLMAEAEAAKTRSLELQQQLTSRTSPPSESSIKLPPSSSNTASQPWIEPSTDYSMFYESLTPHGSWLNVEGYGYAFRPNLTDRSTWRPYVDGRWVSTEQGWAWDSREPFGWACYHYGRWLRLSRHGWVWIPGREWAPAWVSWRSGNDCVGWAPLPPAVGYGSIGHDCDARYGLSPSSYTFIQASHFGRSSYVNVSLSFSNVASFFHQTFNITNIVRVQRQQTPLYINRGGPAIDWVERHCGSRIERAPVQIVRSLERPTLNPRGTRQSPSFIAAPLPSGRSDRHHSLPTAERVSQPTLVDGWKDVPDLVRERLRQTITRQAQEPQPKTTLVNSSPEAPLTGPSVDGVRDASSPPAVRPARPVPNSPARPGHLNPRQQLNVAPNTAQSTSAMDSGTQAAIARREAERQLQQAESERLKLLARQESMNRQQKQLETQQAEQAALRQGKMEQEKQALERPQRENAAAKAREASLMAAQQQEAAQLTRQKEAQAIHAEAMKKQEIEARMQADQIRTEILAKQQQAKEEMTRREQELASQRTQMAAEMKAQQEAAEKQRAELLEQQRQEAAMRAAQEAAAMKAQQEAAERQREAAMEAQQEAAERQRQIDVQRQQQEAAMRAQQEAAERAQREAAERAQQEAARRAQEEAMRQQEEARRAMEEAAQRAAEEAARRSNQPPAQP